jgi:hypothetical protein
MVPWRKIMTPRVKIKFQQEDAKGTEGYPQKHGEANAPSVQRNFKNPDTQMRHDFTPLRPLYATAHFCTMGNQRDTNEANQHEFLQKVTEETMFSTQRRRGDALTTDGHGFTRI